MTIRRGGKTKEEEMWHAGTKEGQGGMQLLTGECGFQGKFWWRGREDLIEVDLLVQNIVQIRANTRDLPENQRFL